MAPVSGARSGLRTRCNEDKRPLEQLSIRERGLRAAKQVLDGVQTLQAAMQLYAVSYSAMTYYKAKLLNGGYAALAAAVEVDASRGSEAQRAARSRRKNKAQLAADSSAREEDYCQAYILAGQLTPKLGKRKAALEASEKHDVHISASTAWRASQTPGQPPKKPGRALILGAALEYKLESFCLLLRSMRLPILRCMIITYVNVLVQGTEAEELLKHGEVRSYWYYNWLRRAHRLKTANIKPLEVKRAQWATSANALTHYNMLKDVMLEHGIAVPNPSFDPDDPNSEQIKILKPERLVSMDETRLTNDTTDNNKSKCCRSIVGKENDEHVALANKGSGDGTGIGGSTGDGKDTPGFFIFSNDIIHSEDVAEHKRPVCRRLDPANPGKPLPCRFWCNKKGGVTGDLGLRYIKGCVQPALPDLSPDHPAILIMDGHGSHFTLELLQHCRDVGLHIILRPPHTTHVLQGEDVVHFGVFKPKYRQEKLKALSAAVLQGRTCLNAGDLLSCARAPWEEAFNQANCLRAWDKIGVVPFTRRVYWLLLGQEKHRKQLAAAEGIDTNKVEIEGMVRIMYPQVCPNPAAGEECPEAGSDGEQPPGQQRKKRKPAMNSAAIWDKPDGVTGDEALNIIRESTEAKQAKAKATMEKKAERYANKEARQRSDNELGAGVWADLCTLEREVAEEISRWTSSKRAFCTARCPSPRAP